MSEVDCSASTSWDSSIVFISHLQSVLCFTLASYSYNCCVALLQPGKGLSSSFSSGELDAALVVQPLMLHWWLWLILSALCTAQQRP